MFSKNIFSVASLLVAATIGGAMSMSIAKGPVRPSGPNPAPTKASQQHASALYSRQQKLMQEINLAQKQHQLTVKEANKLRRELSDVARKKREFKNDNRANGEVLTKDDKNDLEEELNKISVRIKKLQLEKRAQ